MILFATLLLSSGTAAPAVAAPPTAALATSPLEGEALLRALPADTLGFFGAWEIDDFRATFEHSTYAQLLRHPEMKGFLEHMREVTDYDNWDMNGDLPVHPAAVWNALHGSVVGFVRGTPVPSGEPDFSGGILIESPDGAADFEQMRALVVELLDGDDHRTGLNQAHGRATLRTWTPLDAYSSNEPVIVMAQVDELTGLVFAETVDTALELARTAVDQYSEVSEDPGILANSALQTARSQPGGGGTFEGFLDLGTMLDLVGVPEDRETARLMDLFGVADLRALYASGALGAGEHVDGVFSLEVAQTGGFFTQVQNLFSPAPHDLLTSMPKDASQIHLLNFDVEGLVELTLDTVGEFNPQWAQMAKGGLQMAGGIIGIDVENELLPQFTGEFGGFTMSLSDETIEELQGNALGNPELGMFNTAGLVGGSSVGIIGLEDGEDLALWVEDLIAMAGDEVELGSRQVHGFTMYGVEVENSMQAYWSFTDDALFYTIGPSDPLIQALAIAERGAGPSAKDNPRFQNELRAHAGASAIMLSDSQETLRMMLSAASNFGPLMDLAGNQDMAEFADIPWPSESVAELFKSTIAESFRASGGRFQLRVNVR